MNNLSKMQKNIIIIVIVIAIAIIGYYVYGKDSKNNDILTDDEMLVKKEGDEKEIQKEIKVHITGAVQNEGIITLEENARVADAIEKAGGLKDDADMSKINLAYVVEDGAKIKIPSLNDKTEADENEIRPTEDEEVVESIPEGSRKSGTDIININKASQTELETLPGIGPSIALKIVNYREENGKFSRIEDLKEISGIGEDKFENLKGLVSVK